MCASSGFKIKNIRYDIYGGYYGSNFSKTSLNINDDINTISFYDRHDNGMLNSKRPDKRNFDILKKELDQYTKEELIAGFYDMLENFEEH